MDLRESKGGFSRSIQLTRGVIDMETGEFPATVATNGPASDPHILDIRTLVVPDQTPMFVNHDANPISQLGNFTNPRKTGKSTRLGGASLKMTGRIFMDGDNPLGAIRRDVAERMKAGDISQLSVRWGHTEGVTTNTPRNALKENHFAFSNVEGGWEQPMFIERAPVLESSIVGLGADTAALIGRSQDTGVPQHIRDFYTMLTRSDMVHEATDPVIDETELDDEPEEEFPGYRALVAALAETGGGRWLKDHVEDWQLIRCGSGELLVPQDVADVWEGAAIMAQSPGELKGREEPGHSGEVLDTPVPSVHGPGVEVLQELSAFIRDLNVASDAQLLERAVAMIEGRRGTDDHERRSH